MTSTAKSIATVVLTYFIFGLFNLLRFGEYLVPVTYIELFVFVICVIAFVQNKRQIKHFHYLFVAFASFSLISHPFFGEIVMSQQQQIAFYNSWIINILAAVKWLLLSFFFFLLCYDKEKNVLKIEWLLPSVLALACVLYDARWYVNFIFLLAGLSAFYTLRRRSIGKNFIMEILIGVGFLYLFGIFIF